MGIYVHKVKRYLTPEEADAFHFQQYMAGEVSEHAISFATTKEGHKYTGAYEVDPDHHCPVFNVIDERGFEYQTYELPRIRINLT